MQPSADPVQLTRRLDGQSWLGSCSTRLVVYSCAGSSTSVQMHISPTQLVSGSYDFLQRRARKCELPCTSALITPPYLAVLISPWKLLLRPQSYYLHLARCWYVRSARSPSRKHPPGTPTTGCMRRTDWTSTDLYRAGRCRYCWYIKRERLRTCGQRRSSFLAGSR
ncbi:hypothetical protein GCM10017687_26500 [Streptomyces echinatus]